MYWIFRMHIRLLLQEGSHKLVTINTQCCLYRYTRLQFGIASAPAIFQKIMDTILHRIPGVLCYIDNVPVTGKVLEEHIINLKMVLQRAKQYRVWIRREKCHFLQPSLEFLGHRIDAEGCHPLESKVQAITRALVPKNITKLRSFLELLN